MARIKGSPKTGGRKKGTPNKTTAETKAKLKLLFDSELDNILEHIQDLSLKDRADLLVRIAGYILPKAEQKPESGDITISIKRE